MIFGPSRWITMWDKGEPRAKSYYCCEPILTFLLRKKSKCSHVALTFLYNSVKFVLFRYILQGVLGQVGKLWMVIWERKHWMIFNQMVFLLLQRWEILYGTTKIQK